ncbi:hypothetical protein [Kitasatospora kifunensis]|uniref:Uncharacterized protein n=1 Tax=Kitasatospora kifunensis TaxID=58351 RepID=A0A7W7R6D4_KITKI|nr:hypothetical protein [Kitasatospora kifunensis]MBB4926199.1 hypothetical protein [Kitasatospora kifunensis]
MNRQVRTTVLGLAALLTAAGCSTVGTPTPPIRSMATPPASTPPASTPPASTAPLVALSEPANGTTVTVPAGATVRLVLHSTYWAAPQSSAPDRLAAVGAPRSSPSAGPGCHPGSGCGTVSADFLARAAATVRLTSTRSSCGEALLCRPGQRDFTVTVVISPPTSDGR